MLQIAYYTICGVLALTTSLLDPARGKSHVRTLVDTTFHVLILPLSFYVSGMFWGLYLYDRELVFPAHLDAIVTPYYNHQKHTLVIVWTVLETVIVAHAAPTRRAGSFSAGLFCAVYLGIVLWVQCIGGVWAYPILGVLGVFGKIVFCFACIIVYVLLFRVGASVSNILHGSEPLQKTC